MDSALERRLESMVTTQRQSRLLMEWNIPGASADKDNAIGNAWSLRKLVDMLPDSIPDSVGRPAPFAVNKIWYRGASPVFNGPDPVQNAVDMVLWLVRNGHGSLLSIGVEPDKPWDEFLAEKNREINTEHFNNIRKLNTEGNERDKGAFSRLQQGS